MSNLLNTTTSLHSAALAIVLAPPGDVPLPVTTWARGHLRKLVGDDELDIEEAIQPAAKPAETPDTNHAALSPSQARQAIDAFSKWSRDVMRAIVGFGPKGFDLDALAKSLGKDAGDLRGVWTGTTRVTRRLVGDSDAYLIDWRQREDGGYDGHLHPLTLASFADLFGK